LTASLRAGLLLINIGVDGQAHSWALFINLTVDGQAHSWTCCINIVLDGQAHSWTSTSISSSWTDGQRGFAGLSISTSSLMARLTPGLSIISIDIVVDGQPPCWTLIFVNIIVDSQPPCWSSLDARISSGVSLLPASALDFYCFQHPRWTFIVASIRAGLLSLPASALDFYFCRLPRRRPASTLFLLLST